MNRSDAEGAEGAVVRRDSNDAGHGTNASGSRHHGLMSSGLSATAWESFRASLRFIYSVLAG